MVYTLAHFGSEIFERLRSSKYTPSVSLSLDSSLREGAGNGLCHPTGRSETPGLRAIFIAPTKGLHHSTGCSLNSDVAGDFHRPYEGRVPLNVPPGNSDVAGDFHRPYGGAGSIQPGGRKLRGCGRFSSPLRRAGAIQPGGRRLRRCGRFSSPLRRAFSIQPGGRGLRRCGRFSSPLRRGGYHSLGKSGVGADAPTPLGVSGRDEITVVYLAQASIWLWISAMMSSRPESRMVASMVATVCSGSWVPVIRMGRYSL